MKYRSNIWFNLSNNKACQKALNLWSVAWHQRTRRPQESSIWIDNKMACKQRTLTAPDTWSCPTLVLTSVLMLRPVSPELVMFPDF